MAFKDTEKRRYKGIKGELFSGEACCPGMYRRARREFCLAERRSVENLDSSFRDKAVQFFQDRAIVWHDAIRPECPAVATPLPSNHLCCSQCACVNALWPMTEDPDLLAGTFRRFLPELAEPLPFEADRFADGVAPYLTFAWIGTRNYLGEVGNRGRGRNATGGEFAFRFRRYDGRRQLVLGEWKYTEAYGTKPIDVAMLDDRARGSHETRVRVYEQAFHHWQEARPDLPPYDTFFTEPFYQLMRLTLLAQEMERSRACGDGEMEADIVSVLHVAPAANVGFTTNSGPAPALRRYGETVGAAWTQLAPRGRFLSISNERLLTVIEEVAPTELASWRDWLLKRYG